MTTTDYNKSFGIGNRTSIDLCCDSSQVSDLVPSWFVNYSFLGLSCRSTDVVKPDRFSHCSTTLFLHGVACYWKRLWETLFYSVTSYLQTVSSCYCPDYARHMQSLLQTTKPVIKTCLDPFRPHDRLYHGLQRILNELFVSAVSDVEADRYGAVRVSGNVSCHQVNFKQNLGFEQKAKST